MKTYFIDIDKTIFSAYSKDFSDILSGQEIQQLLPGVKDKFDEWSREGSRVILTTARKEPYRAWTEGQLQSAGLHYNLLIMDCGVCPRVLINDLKGDGSPGAYCVNLERNKGFVGIEIP